jgi:quercetin dioxygenase-like cupin family protein
LPLVGDLPHIESRVTATLVRREVSNMTRTKALATGLIATVIVALAFGGLAWATSSSGTSSTLVGPPATFDGFNVKRKGINDWEVEIEAKRGVALATQTITFQPGGYSGWHSHPGPVFISVKEGTMTFYEHDCSVKVVTAGEGFLDVGDHPHFARNEGSVQATNVVTYFIPPHTTTLRIDQPQPLTCAVP